MNKPSVLLITKTLGAAAICDALGVGPHAVRYAKTVGMFPSSWFAVLKGMCEAAEIDCPLDAFSWKGQAGPEGDGSASPDPSSQEDAA